MNEFSFILTGFVFGLLMGMSSVLIGGYTTYLTTQFGHQKSSNHVAGVGLLVIAYMLMLLLIASLIAAGFIASISLDYQQALLILMPLLAIILGIAMVRRYFWHAPIVELSHPKRFAAKHISKTSDLLQPLFIALTLLYAISPTIIISILLFSILSLITNTLPLFWCVSYSFGIIVPIYAVLVLVSTKTKASKILLWQEKIKATMNLYIGLGLVLLAWIVYYIAVLDGSMLS